MGRSFLGGFLGALLALALVGVVLTVRGQSGRDDYRATLERQIEQFDRWQRTAPPIYRPGGLDYQSARQQFLAERPELQAYGAWLTGRLFREYCPTGGSPLCEYQARNYGVAELRDPRHLDAYLAERRR